MSQNASSTPVSSPEASCETAMRLQVAGRLDQAEPIYRQILEHHPTHAAANYCLGMLLVQLRRPAQGVPHLLAALTAAPAVADYWLGYLEALLLIGDVAAATETLVLARRHGLAGAAADEFAARLQAASASRGASEHAAEALERIGASVKKPARGAQRREAAAISRLEARALDLVQAGRFADALPVAREMTVRFSRHGAGWKIFAAMLWAAGSFDEALAAMRTSVELLPQDVEAHANLGTALNKLRRIDEAERCLRHALSIDPEFPAVHTQLGDSLQLQGRYAEAEASFRRAIALHPSHDANGIDAPHSSLLFMLNHNPEVSADALFAEHCVAGAQIERAVGPHAMRYRHAAGSAANDPERRLDLGFVSADLRNHAVASFIEPILHEWRDNPSLRITVYNTHPTDDEVSLRLRGHVARWFDAAPLSNAALAQKIADDGIDVLVDLSGHTSLHRLGVFAHKPAPVQTSWLGYPGTTGLASMDYYLTDRHFLPPEEFERYFTEKLAYVPVVWPFQPFAGAPPVNALPALASGSITFGSFNRLGKINAATVRLWSQLLRALPSSRMMLVGIPLESQHHRLIDWFAAAGIERQRLTFHPWSNMETHLALHHQVDIGLESTPYTGCTTSNHALWMGVPSLTLIGPTPASRLSAANLGHLGLNEFIAASADDFVAKGLRWANDLPALAALRAGLRERWRDSPSRDPAFVASGIERAFRQMWRRWCSGQPAESFEVSG